MFYLINSHYKGNEKLNAIHFTQKKPLFQVDRSVTGLVAQQQCVGPLHTPLAGVAVVALSLFSLQGAATAIGEQPIKGLVSPAAGARMAVGEALTNLVFARVSALKVKNPLHF